MSESTKPKRPTLDLQVNLPCSGLLKYADWFSHPEYGEKLKGVVVIAPEQATEAYPAGEYTHFFFPGADKQLLELGAIEELAAREGKRQFKVLGKPILTLKATEVKGEDGKRRRSTALLVNGVRAGTTGVTRTASTAAASPPVQDHRGEDPPETAGQGARLPDPTPPPATDAEALARRKMMSQWDEVGEAYEVGLRLAQRAFRRAGLVTVEPAALHAAAATIVIQADRQGARAFRGIGKAFGEYLERTDPRGAREQAIATGATERAMAKAPERPAAAKKDPYTGPDRNLPGAAQPAFAGLEDRPEGLDSPDDDGLPF